ncbi:LCP family protein [Streptomyces sp. SID14478]|uniref:LCP family protein n=1 Tax=Streptomyces sp. SID14478 TaxID=2706073 RepID=UPI0013DE7DD0|nr:LCP family protein [Streptomyces sp. SID14478]NEB82186.1 LCP family protein [Streptomyces sp. SID14478]
MGRSSVRGERSQQDGRGEQRARVGELGPDARLHEGSAAGEDGEPADRRPLGHRRAGARPRRRRNRILGWTAGVVAVLVLGSAGAGYLYYEHLNSNIKTDKLNLGEHKVAKPTPNAAGQTPLNILLIGSDSRNSKENLKLGGSKASVGAPPLADVQMLLHVSADRSNMSVVSMPRDTLLPLPKCTDPKTGKVYEATVGRRMVNESLGRGGPGCTVAMWEEFTGIHIDHFMMIDFSGVVSMADAIGGVPVCVDKNIKSRSSNGEGSGLKLKKGTTYVKGEQALQWLRTRHGFVGGTDIARARAQHMYMSAMVREMRKNATISNPGKLRELAEQATRSLHPDEGLDTVKKLYDLSNELKKPEPKRITMTTMPFYYVGARVAPKEGAAKMLFDLIRDDEPLDGKGKKKVDEAAKVSDDPAAADDKIAVQVQNGTRTATTPAAPGRASTVSQLLVGKGFTQARADQSHTPIEETTVIRYPSADLEGDAQRVAKSLGIPFGSVKKSTEVSGVTLVVGADWTTGTAYKKPAADAKDALDKDETQNGAAGGCMPVDPNYTW